MTYIRGLAVLYLQRTSFRTWRVACWVPGLLVSRGWITVIWVPSCEYFFLRVCIGTNVANISYSISCVANASRYNFYVISWSDCWHSLAYACIVSMKMNISLWWHHMTVMAAQITGYSTVCIKILCRPTSKKPSKLWNEGLFLGEPTGNQRILLTKCQ